MGNKQGLTDEQKFEALRLRAEGLGFQRIANELGLKRDQVRGFMRTKAGVKMASELGLDLSYVAKENKNVSIERECRYCKRKFHKKGSNINSCIYCSDRCKKDYRNRKMRETRKKKEYVCRHCERTFVRDGSQVYCSNDCRYEYKECIVCGESFRVGRNSQQETCSNKCGSKLSQRTHEQYYKDFSDIHKGAIVPLTMYDGLESDMTVWCVSCQDRTTGKAREFIRSVRAKSCEHCGHVSSEGERAIERWLNGNGIRYRAEQSFEDLVDVYPLRFDFAVLNEDETIKCLIEYDGIQHFEPVETFGGVPFLVDQQRKDEMKNEYAKQKNIMLYRINYKQRRKINKLMADILSR